METTEQLERFISLRTRKDFRGRLLDRGAAWSLMRQEGALPQDAPPFGASIDTDLADYGFSILRAALALKEAAGSADISQKGFEHAAKAFEALVRNEAPDHPERGFYRAIAGTAYHLAGYSAIAYSIFHQRENGENISPAEQALTFLVLRDLGGLRDFTSSWLQNDMNSDESLAAALKGNAIDEEDAISIILNSTVCRGLSYFDFALQTGDDALVVTAKNIFKDGVKLAGDASVITMWWLLRLCLSLITDLWEDSLHVNLPKTPPAGGGANYTNARELFLVSLYARKTAEVELWPSQVEAARRAGNVTDDMVVALPTSAGKTRVAEIAALMTLSTQKRVLIVTPLRALSAQTERSFRKTFAPLGFSVSSLYGASGVSAGDEDALRSKDIIISTPEKLDFALRSDPSLIDDVGLIVLDEGHMIGPTEREIRYEILVQKLLLRPDAAERRIVCLSAILPDGEQLNDLTAWIRHDVEGGPVKSSWRPTRQRFGTLTWHAPSAKLKFDLENDGPFLAKFVEEVPARGRQKKSLPRDAKDLSLFAAWKFAEQGKRTLIFITQANWVEGFGEVALDLVNRGYLPSLLENPATIQRALEVGREWLGDGHPAVESLKIGLAIHHGGLPKPFLRELELLLSNGTLKVIAASPTLSQGLNINAAVLLVPYLVRSGALITGEEFANVAGRAGRAFVDVEGLILHVIFDKHAYRLNQWKELVASAKSRTLQSGLFQIINEIIQRLADNGTLEREDAVEYLMNSREGWTEVAGNDDEGEEDGREPLDHLVEKLDATVLGLIEAFDAESADLPRLLDEALRGSLWQRQIAREKEGTQNNHRVVLAARARLIWNTTTPAARKGHYAMGVGLEAGLALDAMADELAGLLDQADLAAIQGNEENLSVALIGLARRLLTIRPFAPSAQNPLPGNWEEILQAWITGVDVNVIGPDNMSVVEEVFSYRLVWALEALRTRRVSQGWTPEIVAGGGAGSLETGVPQMMMSMLIRAGLPSRRAAMAAVRTGEANFVDISGMQEWLKSKKIVALTKAGNWPTAETAALWQRFHYEALSGPAHRWEVEKSIRFLNLPPEAARPPAGRPYRIEINDPSGEVWVCTPDYQRLVRLKKLIFNNPQPSFYSAHFVEGDKNVHLQRFGRGAPTWIDDGLED